MRRGKLLFVILMVCILILPVHFTTSKSMEKEEIKVNVEKINAHPSVMPQKTVAKDASHLLKPTAMPLDIPVATEETIENHPFLAVDENGNLLGAFTNEEDFSEYSIVLAYSMDNGETWNPLLHTTMEGIEDYPAIDYWGNGIFYGTFQPDPTDCDGAAQYVLSLNPEDLSTLSLVYFDWTDYDQRDRQSPDIATYNDVGDADWWYGVMVTTESSDYEDAAGENIPTFNFPDYEDSNSGWIWWWDSYPNSAHAAIDIDKSNGWLYAVWDNYNESRGEGRDILLAIADVHDWWYQRWNISWYYLGGEEDDTYPDVAAVNGNIYIVCQADINLPGKQDIICYYSHDGGATWDMSIVAGDPAKDEMYPSIVAYGDSATCIYSVDGNLFVTHTTDGGATWSEPKQINDEDESVSMEYRDTYITNGGNVIWSDIRNGNNDVYYDSVGLPPSAIINIESISGGLGVKATVSNTGTVAAENVPWSIDVSGGIVLLGKHAEGTITSLNPGESATIKDFVIGFGKVTVTVKVGSVTKTASGFLLGPLAIGLK